MRSWLDPTAGGWGHGGHQDPSPALQPPDRQGGQDQAAMDSQCGGRQPCPSHYTGVRGVRAIGTSSRHGPSRALIGNDAQQERRCGQPLPSFSSVCLLHILGQNSHLYPHLLKTSGIVKDLGVSALFKPPLSAQLMGLPR